MKDIKEVVTNMSEIDAMIQIGITLTEEDRLYYNFNIPVLIQYHRNNYNYWNSRKSIHYKETDEINSSTQT